jgi:hypothetical protein
MIAAELLVVFLVGVIGGFCVITLMAVNVPRLLPGRGPSGSDP